MQLLLLHAPQLLDGTREACEDAGECTYTSGAQPPFKPRIINCYNDGKGWSDKQPGGQGYCQFVGGDQATGNVVTKSAEIVKNPNYIEVRSPPDTHADDRHLDTLYIKCYKDPLATRPSFECTYFQNNEGWVPEDATLCSECPSNSRGTDGDRISFQLPDPIWARKDKATDVILNF